MALVRLFGAKASLRALCRGGTNPSVSRWTSSTAVTAGGGKADDNGTPGRRDVPSFDDHAVAFRSKTTGEVARAYVVYQLCSWPYLVSNQERLMRLGRAALGPRLFAWLMKATFYGHFVAGQDLHRGVATTVGRLREFGVKPILDYSVEEDVQQQQQQRPTDDGGTSRAASRAGFYLDEAACERNLETFLECLHAVAAGGGAGMAAIKLTALGRPQMLLRVADAMARSRAAAVRIEGRGNVAGLTAEQLERRLREVGVRDTARFMAGVTPDAEGLVRLFPRSGGRLLDGDRGGPSDAFRVPCLRRGRMVRLLSELTGPEVDMFRNAVRRLNAVAHTASALGVRVMVDAEQSYFQPAISRLTLELMRRHNGERPVVFNTYQCCMRDAPEELRADMDNARLRRFHFGAKLVRGAYVDQERKRAAAAGLADPTNATYEDTTAAYHGALAECVERVARLRHDGDGCGVAVMIASHNEDTVRYAIRLMESAGVAPGDKIVCFGQLLGMCDFITFPLSQAGYSAYKYLPYGPVDEVLPYLSRRATENKGVLKKLNKEKTLLRRELVRRVLRGQLFYRPDGNGVHK